MSVPAEHPSTLGPVADVLAISDTIYRFTQGVDENDEDLLNSAFAEDAVVDIATSLKSYGYDFPVLEGRDTVVGGFQAGPGQLRTTHIAVNPRPSIRGDEADLRVIVQAMHIVPDNDSRRCQTTSVYHCTLIRQDTTWVVRRMDVDVVWYEGDLAVITTGR